MNAVTTTMVKSLAYRCSSASPKTLTKTPKLRSMDKKGKFASHSEQTIRYKLWIPIKNSASFNLQEMSLLSNVSTLFSLKSRHHQSGLMVTM